MRAVTTPYIPRHLFHALQAPPVTVGDFIDAYLVGYGDWHGAEAEYPPRPGSRTTEAGNMAYALTDLRKTISVEPDGSPRHVANLRPDELRPGDLRACQQHMIDAGRCRSECNKRKNKILRWVRWLVEYEHADANIIARLEVVKAIKVSHPTVRNRKRVEDVPAEVVAATLRCCDPELRRAIQVQKLAGMRPGELIAMRVCYLHAGPSGRNLWAYRPLWHKTADKVRFRREIPLGPKAIELLREQASTMGEEMGLFGPTVPKLGDQQDQRAIWRWKTVNGYYQAVKRASKRAKVAEWYPNQLRHATLTEASNAAGLETAASIGGHTDTKTTRDHYFHGHAEKAREWAEQHG